VAQNLMQGGMSMPWQADAQMCAKAQ